MEGQSNLSDFIKAEANKNVRINRNVKRGHTDDQRVEDQAMMRGVTDDGFVREKKTRRDGREWMATRAPQLVYGFREKMMYVVAKPQPLNILNNPIALELTKALVVFEDGKDDHQIEIPGLMTKWDDLQTVKRNQRQNLIEPTTWKGQKLLVDD
ncbi:hypothetical protein PPACK8108_LOCUS21372 [Phakopsora pachyrhizi]|uniref:Uncharacterized protein n=1 Tax=Phakopsora pachyrhizi TaxID=170000 RepID=A0AAV0BJE3_PHAPC|nr:hypothetical protein PPACK8108_LOCUS21372 [Phakopsora pachyrhizi]